MDGLLGMLWVREVHKSRTPVHEPWKGSASLIYVAKWPARSPGVHLWASIPAFAVYAWTMAGNSPPRCHGKCACGRQPSESLQGVHEACPAGTGPLGDVLQA